jgi:MFS family permease
MQQVLGYVIEAGLAYLPLALTIIAASGVAAQLINRLGTRPVLAIGMVLLGGALAWFSQVSVGGGFVSDILGPSLLGGAGLGFAFVPVTVAAVAGVRDQESGLASGLINTSQQIGGALGLAVLATISNSRTHDVMADTSGNPAALAEALTEGFQAAFLGGAAIAALGLVLTLALLRGETPPRTEQETASAGERMAEAKA